MGNSRNRNAGHKFERDCAKKLRELGYTDVRCSREVSRLRDAKKVDLANADEDVSGRLPYNIQCKTLAKAAPYPKLLAELEEHNGRNQINIVLHKQTENVNGRFLPRGEFVMMNADDFYMMAEKLLKLEQLLVQQKPADLGADYINQELINNRVNKQL